MRRFTLAMLLALTSLRAAAADSTILAPGGVAYVVPSDSPVRYVSVDDDSVATFEGRFAVTGTFRYGYSSADASRGMLVLSLVPDEADSVRLPYWGQRGPVDALRFTNDEAFVKAVVPPETVDALKGRSLASVSGRVTVRVEKYQASVECDTPTYLVSFVSLQSSSALRASRPSMAAAADASPAAASVPRDR